MSNSNAECLKSRETKDGVLVLLGRLENPVDSMEYCVGYYRNGPAGKGYLNVTNYYKTREEAEVEYNG